MTPGRSAAAGDGSRDCATVLDELESEALAAESTLRSDREDEIAAWGRRAEVRAEVPAALTGRRGCHGVLPASEAAACRHASRSGSTT